jgi:hypothetical protein
MRLPSNITIPWNSEALNKLTRNPDAIGYFKNLVLSLRKMYGDIARAVNQNENIQYVAQDAQPTPSLGQAMVWKDTDAGAGNSTHYLCFNDGGTIVLWGSNNKA